MGLTRNQVYGLRTVGSNPTLSAIYVYICLILKYIIVNPCCITFFITYIKWQLRGEAVPRLRIWCIAGGANSRPSSKRLLTAMASTIYDIPGYMSILSHMHKPSGAEMYSANN